MTTYPGQIAFNAKALKIAAAEDDRTEVVGDSLVKRSGRCKVRGDLLRGHWVFSVPINTGLKKFSTLSSRHGGEYIHHQIDGHGL